MLGKLLKCGRGGSIAETHELTPCTCSPCNHSPRLQVGYGDMEYDDGPGEAHDRLKPHGAPPPST